MQLKELYIGFIADCVKIGRSKSTTYGHTKRCEKFIIPAIGNVHIEEIKKSHVGMVLERARAYGGTSSETQSVITLRRLLCYGVGEGYKLNFDWKDIEVPPYTVQSDVQALSFDEIKHIREVMKSDEEKYSRHASARVKANHIHMLERTRCLFELLLHTGLRISEALAINIEDLDFNTCELRIENAKTGAWDSVYLYGTEEAITKYLSMRTDEHPALFVSGNGGRLTLNGAKSTLRRLKKRVGLKKELTHKLFRSSFVTTLLRNKCDPKQTQHLARHKSIQTTFDYYYQVVKEELKPIHKAIMSDV